MATCQIPVLMPADPAVDAQMMADFSNFCSDPGDPTSQYKRNPLENIFYFPGAVGGVVRWSFCLDKNKDGPRGAFESVSSGTTMPDATQAQQLAVAFITANAPSNGSDLGRAQALFTLLGVDPAGLNAYDAFAVSQIAIWGVLGQADPAIMTFPLCDGGANPKSPALMEAVRQLIALSLAYGSGADVCGSGSTGTCAGACEDPCGLQYGTVCTCVPGPDVPNDPKFCNCVNNLREVCGRILVGPFMLQSSSAAGLVPAITAGMLPCQCCENATFAFANHCGKVIGPPGLNEKFYLAIRPYCKCFAFDVTAQVTETINSIYFFQDITQPSPYQPVSMLVPSNKKISARQRVIIRLEEPCFRPVIQDCALPWMDECNANNNCNSNNNINYGSSNMCNHNCYAQNPPCAPGAGVFCPRYFNDDIIFFPPGCWC